MISRPTPTEIAPLAVAVSALDTAVQAFAVAHSHLQHRLNGIEERSFATQFARLQREAALMRNTWDYANTVASWQEKTA